MFDSPFRVLLKVGGHRLVSKSEVSSTYSSKTPNWRTVLQVEDAAGRDDADTQRVVAALAVLRPILADHPWPPWQARARYSASASASGRVFSQVSTCHLPRTSSEASSRCISSGRRVTLW